jgi:hypothetical protein
MFDSEDFYPSAQIEYAVMYDRFIYLIAAAGRHIFMQIDVSQGENAETKSMGFSDNLNTLYVSNGAFYAFGDSSFCKLIE